MRAILIDPMLRKVERHLDDFHDQRVIQFFIQSHVTTVATLGPTHILLLDEFGIFRAGQHWFGLRDNPEVALAGRGLILGKPTEDGGAFTPCQFPVEVVSRLIRFFDDPSEAEALVPPSKLMDGNKIIGRVPVTGFRSMKKEFITRDGKVTAYDPTA